MMASYSSVLRGKEEKCFPSPHNLFQSNGFTMEEQKKKKKIQDFNLTGTGASGYEEQSTDGLKKVKVNWGNDSIFGSYGLSEHSSSSGLSSPFGSELGSTETDETESEEDEDFIAQLTRQMADYMLKDDDEEEQNVSVDENDIYENRAVQTPNTYGLAGNWSNYNSKEICYYNQESLGIYVKPIEDSVNHQMKNSNTVFYSSDDLKRPIQVYHLKDQPTTAKQKPSNSKGKRVKGTTNESIQKLKTEKNNTQSNLTKNQTLGGHGQSGDKIHHHLHPVQSNGAGMRAIFIGGSGSINGSSGTGVFLPRTINNPNPPPSTTTEPKKKKSGSSTVLIPARVLQALQQHFNHMDALSQSNTCAVSPKNENEAEDLVYKENYEHSEDQTSVVNDQEVQLPQEWIY